MVSEMYAVELFVFGVFVGALIKGLTTRKRLDAMSIINSVLFAFAMSSSSVFFIPFVEGIKYFSSTMVVPFILGAGYGAAGEAIFKRVGKTGGLAPHDIKDLEENMHPAKLVSVTIFTLVLSWLIGAEWGIIGVLGMFFTDVLFYMLNFSKHDIVLEHYHVGLMILALYILLKHPVLFGSAMYLITSEFVQQHSFAYGKKYFLKATFIGLVLVLLNILLVVVWG